jgi:hypothetical protein
MGNQKWSEVPRLYIVLRTIGQLKLLDDLINDHYTDLWFPFSPTLIPRALSLYPAFLQTQTLVLNRSIDLGRTDSKDHVYLDCNEPFPFTIKSTLGEGGSGKVSWISSGIRDSGYALKTLERRRGRDSDTKSQMRRFMIELKILKRIQHRHCISLVSSLRDLLSAIRLYLIPCFTRVCQSVSTK